MLGSNFAVLSSGAVQFFYSRSPNSEYFNRKLRKGEQHSLKPSNVCRSRLALALPVDPRSILSSSHNSSCDEVIFVERLIEARFALQSHVLANVSLQVDSRAAADKA